MDINEMEFKHTLNGDIALFELEGSLLGESDRAALKGEFTNYLQNGTVKFLIDLTNLKHINSTGLGVFITLYTKARAKDENQGEMVLTNPSENIMNLLTITKLNSVFTVLDSIEQGIQHLNRN